MTESAELELELGRLERLAPGERREACARYVQGARAELRERYEAGCAQPAELLQGLSDRVDALLATLYRASRTSPAATISLVALGGYGRRELFPYSDLDLLILHEGGEDSGPRAEDGAAGRPNPLAARVVDEVIYPLWDAKLQIGYAVRGIEETLGLAADDLTVCTSLLDARLLAGHEGLFHALSAAALRAFFGPEVKRFLAALREERATRHRRFGETVYLLEPNIKLGKGGLRDLNVGLWVAKGGFGVSDFAGLSGAGGATRRQLRALLEAREFLRRLRLAMHIAAGRPQDHLLFEMQETLAPRLFPEEKVPGVTRASVGVELAVERMMHAYYRHARAVVIETDGLIERCGEEPSVELAGGEPATERADEHLRVWSGTLRSADAARFWERPSEIVRAFQVALDRRLPFHWQTRDALAEAAAGEAGLELAADATAAELWLDLLCDPEQEGTRTILMEAHDLGVIAALIPEFGPCTGRVQHDLYHVYTVDLHTLYVVAQLKAWRRGELAAQFPMAVALMTRIAHPRSLFLAALLHDVAKPLGHGHAAKGARLARGVAARLGLDPEEQEAVRLLVDQHLTMAHLSQRRDLSDPTVIRTLATEVRGPELLRQLYLLTLADTAMTAPGNLTEWKASLLEELYMRTYVHLAHGESVAAEERERRLREQEGALEFVLRRARGEPAAAIVPRVPREMLLAFSVDDLVHHLCVALDLEVDPAAVLRVVARRKNGGTTAEITVCCWDAPGRLAEITGVMLAHRIEVLAAQVSTVERDERAAAPAPTVVDIFTVRLPTLDPREDDEVLAAFGADLERALRGELAVPELVARHTRPSGIPPRFVPRVEARVSVDNEISERSTVIDVQAPDRLGVLYAITRALSEQGLAILLSKVATEAGRVVDIFYVRSGDRDGGKVTDEARLAELRDAVLAAVDGLATAKDR